ncbi:hypothetical protein PG997_010043 [Apiospora hydei]|uniref:Uncharacterized protein n=1 Tax=Apiospora hydei TaxID=1337664 RepID=A0ABR1VYY2_9PEZI
MPAKTTSSVSGNATLSSPGSSPTETAATTALSKGQKVAIAIGAFVFVGLLAALVLFQIRRRRRQVIGAVNNQRVDTYQGKPELPNNSAPRAELESNANAFMPELEGHGMYPEMDGHTKPVEAEAPQEEASVGQPQVTMEVTIRNQRS